MSLAIRNVDVDLDTPPDIWPLEALVTVLERGLIADWQPLFRAIRTQPWGVTARRVEQVIAMDATTPVSSLFRNFLTKIRTEREQSERAQVATLVREAIVNSELTQAEFAKLLGTSASRLSTYATGSVTPSAAMLFRIQTFALPS